MSLSLSSQFYSRWLVGFFALSFSVLSVADNISDFQNSWAGKAQALQRQLDYNEPLNTVNIIGTHNSYNSESYRDIDSYLDPQQKHSIYDQLRLGARFIELDVHWTSHTKGWPWNWGTDLMLCHSGIGVDVGNLHLGCGLTDRFAREGFDEVKNWLNANSNEVIVLYIEDHTENHHQELLNIINSSFGSKVYQSGGCSATAGNLSKAQVRAAGKQVVMWLDGGCSSHGTMANMAFNNLGMSRVWEDRTSVGAVGAFFTGGSVSRLNSADIIQAQKNGVNIVNLDDMTHNDGRLAAGVWSWDNNEPNNAGGNQDCAVSWGNGRWDDANCSTTHHYACKNGSTWQVSVQSGSWQGGAAACTALGNGWEFSTPVSSQENEALKAVKGGVSHVWLNYSDTNQEGAWVTASSQQANEFRSLRDGRSNLCLDVAGGNSANGTNVRLWTCNGSAAQAWKYDAGNGFLVSQVGKCLDNRGQDYNGGGIVIWDCVNSNNLRFDWNGTSLRSRHDHNIAVDAYGTSSGSDVGQWSYHGGANQQWHWGN